MKAAIIVIVAICIIGYIVHKRKQNKKIILSPDNTITSTIEGELPFSDVISFFKTLNLKKGEDIPFICQKSERTEEIFNIYNLQFELVGYKWLFVGVYNEKEESITNYKVIYAKSFEQKLEELLSNEDLVILE